MPLLGVFLTVAPQVVNVTGAVNGTFMLKANGATLQTDPISFSASVRAPCVLIVGCARSWCDAFSCPCVGCDQLGAYQLPPWLLPAFLCQANALLSAITSKGGLLGCTQLTVTRNSVRCGRASRACPRSSRGAQWVD